MSAAPELMPPARRAPGRRTRVPALPGAELHHAVAGSAELDAVLTVDPDPGRVTHVATPRTVADIVYARARGVQRFVIGGRHHLDDVLRHAPGSEVLLRLTSDGRATSGEPVMPLVRRALAHDLRVGLRLRLGAGAADAGDWNEGLRAVSRLRWALECEGHDLSTVDLGRGPADPDLVRTVGKAVDVHLGPLLPRVLVESSLSHRWRPRHARFPEPR